MKDGQRGLIFFYQEGDPPNFEGTNFTFVEYAKRIFCGFAMG